MSKNFCFNIFLPLLFILLALAACSDRHEPENLPEGGTDPTVETVYYKVAVIMPLSNETEKKRIERTVAWAQ